MFWIVDMLLIVIGVGIVEFLFFGIFGFIFCLIFGLLRLGEVGGEEFRVL